MSNVYDSLSDQPMPTPDQQATGLASLVSLAKAAPVQPLASDRTKPVGLPDQGDFDRNALLKEYSDWQAANPNGDPVSLGHFAQGMDQRQGTTHRSSAYDATEQFGDTPSTPTLQDYAKGTSDAVNSTLSNESNIAGIAGGTLGSMVDEGLNTGTKVADVGTSIGQGLPRMALAGAAGGLPLFAGDAAATTYGETGSLAKAGVAAGASLLPVVGSELGGSIGESLVAKSLLRGVDQDSGRAIVNELVTGNSPKIGRIAGAVTGGITGQETAHQLQTGGSDPFTVQNIASDVFGGASMAMPEAINTLVGTKSAVNVKAQDELYNWAESKAQDIMANRGNTRTPSGSSVDDLINRAVSVSETDSDPNWRKGAVMSKISDLTSESDPDLRRSRVSEIANMLVDTKDMGAISDSAERDAKMAYVAPPTDIVGLTDLARRVNTLKQDSLARLDDMASQGIEGAPSAAAYKQLEEQGYFKEPIDMEWLKGRFGDNVERSLTNSNATGYSILTQQLANEMLIMSQTAKDARSQDISQTSVSMPDQSKGVMQDRATTANFVDALSKVQQPQLLSDLYDRYVFHEDLDNKGDSGSSSKFMQTVADIVNQQAAGKTPEQLKSVDWSGAKSSLDQVMRQPADDGIGEKNVTVSKATSLGDLVAKDFNGQYVNKIYGRPNRSQREILASDLPTSPSGRTVMDSKSVDQGLNQPGSKDWQTLTDQVKDTISKTSDQDLWNTVAPVFKNSYGRVDPRVQARLQLIIKDLVQSTFELGPTREDNAKLPELGEAGQRLLPKLGGVQGGLSDSTMLSKKLNQIFGESGRDANQVRQDIVKRVAEQSGLQLPQTSAVGDTQAPSFDQVANATPSIEGTYQVFKRALMRQGYEPAEVAARTKTAVQAMLNFNNPVLQVQSMNPSVAYPDKPSNPSMSDMRIGGLYYPDKQLIQLAVDHNVGNTPRSLATWTSLGIMLHEAVHDLQFQGAQHQGLTPPTAYTQERVGAWNALNTAAKFYTSDQKFQYLRTAAEAVVPRDVLYHSGGIMNSTVAGLMRYGANAEPYEFINVFSQVVGLGMLTGEKNPINPENVFRQMPEEQALFAKGIYRDLHDNLSALQTSIADPKFREQAGLHPLQGDLGYLNHQMGWLINQTHKMLVSVEPAKSAAQANLLMQALGGQGWQGPMGLTQYDAPYVMSSPQELQSSRAAMAQVQGWLFGGPAPSLPTAATGTTGAPPKPPKQTQLTFQFPVQPGQSAPTAVNMGAYWRYLGLFQQGLDKMGKLGVPLAPDVAAATRDYIPSTNRITSMLLSLFTTTNGKFDPSNPLIQMRTDESVQGRRDNAQVNKVMDWQQKNEEEAFVQSPQGHMQLSPKAQTDLGYTNIPQRVVASVQALSQTGQLMGQQLLGSRIASAANRTAQLMMTVYPQGQLRPLGYDQAQQDSMKIVNGLVHGGAATSTAAQALGNYPQPVRDSIEGFLNNGIVDSLKDLSNMVTSRTWWMTEQRPGAYLVTSEKGGVKHTDGAQSAFQARRMQTEMARQGFTNVQIVNKSERAKNEGYDAPEGILQNFIQVENEHLEKYLTTNPQGLTQQQLDTIRAYAPAPGEASQAMNQAKGTNKFLINRQRVPTALGMDYVDNMRDYIGRLAGTIARSATTQQIQLIAADPRMSQQTEFMNYVRDNVNQMMTPASDMERSMKALSTAYFIAGHLSSAVVIGTHAINTLPETLLDKGGQGYSYAKTLQHTNDGFADFMQYSARNSKLNVSILAGRAAQKIGLGQSVSPDELKAWAYKKAVDDHILEGGLLDSTFDDNDQKAAAARAFGTGNKVPIGPSSLAESALYRISKTSMLLPRIASSFNNGWAFMAGLNQAIDAGLPADKAFQAANNVRTLALFAGGKSNMPGYMGALGNPRSIPIMRTMHTLQQFGFGMVGKYIDHMSDAVRTDPNIQPGQRAQAIKALGSLTMTQLAMGGLLALPGLAALMTIAEKQFGVQAEAGVRQGIAHLAGADKDPSGFRVILTETAMNGMVNQMTGINIGPRLGVQDFMGTSAYDGFNLADLAGPAGSMITNMVTGLGQIAQGNPQRGVTQLLPNAFKKGVDLTMNKLNYGDFAQRSPMTGQKLYDPTTSEVLEQAAGLTPKAISERQSAQRLITQSNRAYAQDQSKQLDSVAKAVLQGNPNPAVGYAKSQLEANPKLMRDPLQPLRQVSSRAVELQSPPDPLGSTPFGNSSTAQSIAGTFPQGTVQPQSEMDKLRQQLQVEAKLGVTPQKDFPKQMSRAVMVDSFEKKGMTKAQAERMVRMMGL